MIAKLIVRGDNREQALARLDAALAQTQIVGLATNVQFLRHVLRSPSFAQARLDTALIEREKAVLFHQDPVGLPLAVAAATASALLQEQAQQGTDPFSRRDGWQSHGTTERPWSWQIGGQTVDARLRYLPGGVLSLALPAQGDAPAVESPLVFSAANGGLDLEFAGQRTRAQVHRLGEQYHVFTPRGAQTLTGIDLLAHAGEAQTEGGRLTAPMPGKLVSFAVQVGDSVKAGQALAVMEAMKMEHTIAAPHDGLVEELLYLPGDQIGDGAELLRLARA